MRHAWIIVVLLSLGSAGLASPDAATPLPFDPPTRAEAAWATGVALEDPAVRDALGRHAVLGAALGTEKPDAGGHAQRLLDVWFYDYDADAVVWVVVDPARGEVLELVPVDFAFQPPLAGIELERAALLAQELVRDRFPEPLPATAMLVSGPGTVCPENRCVVVAFVEEEPVMDHLVLVNLSQDLAVAVLDDLAEVRLP